MGSHYDSLIIKHNKSLTIWKNPRINFKLVRINLGNRDDNKLNAGVDCLTTAR